MGARYHHVEVTIAVQIEHGSAPTTTRLVEPDLFGYFFELHLGRVVAVMGLEALLGSDRFRVVARSLGRQPEPVAGALVVRLESEALDAVLEGACVQASPTVGHQAVVESSAAKTGVGRDLLELSRRLPVEPALDVGATELETGAVVLRLALDAIAPAHQLLAILEGEVDVEVREELDHEVQVLAHPALRSRSRGEQVALGAVDPQCRQR